MSTSQILSIPNNGETFVVDVLEKTSLKTIDPTEFKPTFMVLDMIESSNTNLLIENTDIYGNAKTWSSEIDGVKQTEKEYPYKKYTLSDDKSRFTRLKNCVIISKNIEELDIFKIFPENLKVRIGERYLTLKEIKDILIIEKYAQKSPTIRDGLESLLNMIKILKLEDKNG